MMVDQSASIKTVSSQSPSSSSPSLLSRASTFAHMLTRRAAVSVRVCMIGRRRRRRFTEKEKKKKEEKRRS